MMKPNTLEIEYALMRYFDFKQNVMVPRVTNMSFLVGFETDMLLLTKSNYAYGIEIKSSKKDLKADLKKDHIKNLPSNLGNKENDWTLSRYYKGLKYFYYAIPEDVLEECEKQIPEYFGIIVVKKYKPQYRNSPEYRLRCKLHRKPQRLFNHKWTEQDRMNLMRIGTMRIFALTRKAIGYHTPY